MKKMSDAYPIDEKFCGDIQAAARRCYNQYLRPEKLYPFLLSGDKQAWRRLDVAGALYQSVCTSCRYGRPKRALWYLKAFRAFCQSAFRDEREREAREAGKANLRGGV